MKSVLAGTTTIHVGDHYEVVGGTARKYYFCNGKRIAMRDNGTLHWLLGDQLGSTSMTLSASGGILSQQRYMAYGVARNVSGTLPTDYRYTGQQEVSYINLYQIGARWYAPSHLPTCPMHCIICANCTMHAPTWR